MDAQLFSHVVSYVPATLAQHLAIEQKYPNRPLKLDTCVLFADVSGFTKLCEAMAAKGPSGDEDLAGHLNHYFDRLVLVISAAGGDVFKFAGDALLVIWPPTSEPVEQPARRAAQCALQIKALLNAVELAPGVTLNIKVGLGVGSVQVLMLGGELGRAEYIATGPALTQAFEAEHHAVQYQTFCWLCIYK